LRPGTVQLTSRLSVVFAVAATEGAAGVSGRSATSVSVIATAIDTVAVPSVTLTCTA
jgi:hypothetical protein